MKTFSNHKDTKDTKRMNFLFVLFVSLWFTNSLFSVPTFIAKNVGGVAPDFCLISTNAISFYFRLDEAAAGPFVDATGQLGNLGSSGSTPPTSYLGKITNCIGFDSTKTQYLSGSALNDVGNITNGDATVTGWFYTSNLTATQVFIQKGQFDNQAGGWSLKFSGLNGLAEMDIQFRNFMGFPQFYTAKTTVGVTVTSNTWYFVCGQFNRASNYMAISLNAGTLNQQAVSATDTPQTSTVALRVGASTVATPPFAQARMLGMLDEFSKWNRLLSNDEVTCLYKAGAPGKNQTYPFTP